MAEQGQPRPRWPGEHGLVDSLGSKIDADGDGNKHDSAVLHGSWDWPPTQELADAIWHLAGS